MTEQEWQESTDPDRMLEFLNRKASKRQLQLFAVACCRRIWPLLTDERSRQGVEIREKGADNQASEEECLAGANAAHAVFMETKGQGPYDPEAPSAAVRCLAFAAYCGSCGDSADTADHAAHGAAYQAGVYNDDAWNAAFQAERSAQCDLLRDIFGKPFRPVTIAPSWLSWNGGEVVKVAQAIYNERLWSSLPQLANALTAAGCQDQEILSHCRHPGEHVRGCWVVDALLGKQAPILMGLTTHHGWLSCPDPTPLLAFLKNRATDRKWRLFSVACCRRIGDLMTDERSRQAIDVAEKIANGTATAENITLARTAANEAVTEAKSIEWYGEAAANFCDTTEYCRVGAALYATRAAKAALSLRADDLDDVYKNGSWDWASAARSRAVQSAALASYAEPTSEARDSAYEASWAAEAAERAHQSHLLRDIFGDQLGPLTTDSAWLPYKDGKTRWSLTPSERVTSMERSWLTWRNGLVVRIASEIYEEEAFDLLPILGDALEDAGCTRAEILDHLHGPGPHVRGCWVLDLLVNSHRR